MKPTYSPASETQYPDYYILDVGDLVDDLIQKWNHIIGAEVNREIVSNAPPVTVYPIIRTVGPYSDEVRQEIYTDQHHSARPYGWQPDVSFIIHHLIDAIKNKSGDDEDLDMKLQLLEYDLATMSYHQLMPNISSQNMPEVYSDTQMKVASLAREFGRKIFQRLVEFGMYKHGYFPYHFAGWQDRCALVALDITHQ